jgi:arginyl-tRNA synthetase
MLRKVREEQSDWTAQAGIAHLDSLGEDAETALMRRLDQFPEVVANAASQSEPHTIANYLRELSGEFHTYYNAHKMLVDEKSLRDARLALSEAVRQVIANGLALLGVSAPESM